jgi:heme/copper-type cytochrome/quinol oxidase subunit 2
METSPQLPETTTSTESTSPSPEQLRQQRQIILIIVLIAFVVFLVIATVAVILLMQPVTTTERLANVFIIFMALESLFLGLTMVILIIQLARLINLLQNEIAPILESTNETVNTLRGTSEFLSDNLVEPVIKVNEQMAGVRQLFVALGLFRRSRK